MNIGGANGDTKRTSRALGGGVPKALGIPVQNDGTTDKETRGMGDDLCNPSTSRLDETSKADISLEVLPDNGIDADDDCNGPDGGKVKRGCVSRRTLPRTVAGDLGTLNTVAAGTDLLRTSTSSLPTEHSKAPDFFGSAGEVALVDLWAIFLP